MNLLRAIVSKPLSFGAIFFVWMPLIGGCGMLALYGLKYWYLTLGAFIFVCMIAGIIRDDHDTSAQDLESEIVRRQIVRTERKISLLYLIGKPDLASGGYSSTKMALWDEFHKLDAEDKRLSAQERTQMVKAYGGYIPDDVQAELDAGVNPYRKKESRLRRMH